ncbi:MAG: hypothetical protein GEV09_01180 [Pseudonocardiaceae bacterium]|nr:hypothetical protein [Pseudonocardiaceae bacterium]
MTGFLVAFGVIFVAELGDKSQLMALTFTARYRALPVLVGITLSTAVVHAVSVAVGYGLGVAVPTGWVALVAAVAFFGFGAWTLRGDTLGHEERAKADRSTRSALVAASVAFFLAELGDKTMLATITLATQHGWFGTWIGSTLGMVAADAVAIVVGRQLGRHLPALAIKVGAGVLFFGFGAWLVVDATGQLTGRPAWDTVAGALDHHAAGWIALGMGLLVLILALASRHRVRREAPVVPTPRDPAALRTRILFGLAGALGLAAPLLVGADVIQPIALFDSPGIVTVGAALVLLGAAVLLAAQSAAADLHSRGTDKVSTTRGLYSRIRHPELTGIVIATAGLLLMVPTALGVLAAVLIVTAVQLQVRAIREPRLAQLHGEDYAVYAARTGRFLPKIGDRADARQE